MLNLRLLPDSFAVCRLAPDAPVPEWARAGDFVSITRTRDELSIVCAARDVPDDVQSVGPWRCFAVAGPLDFALTGVLVSLAAPLAEYGISVFAVATYDTDYLLVREPDVERATRALAAAGHLVT